MEDWAEIRRLSRAEGLPIKAIARKLGISKNTVKRALASNEPPAYRRAPRGSIVDVVEPRIRELLSQYPSMPATVIAERVGWAHGMTVFKARVAALRPVYLPVDPVSRTAYEPGEIAQCDLWFPPVQVPVGYGQAVSPPVLVMVAGYSRVIGARMICSRQVGDLIDGHWKIMSGWGAVPRMLVWDNEGGIGRHAPDKPVLTSEFAAFTGLFGLRVYVCRPRDPEAKGLVERANGYLETSFLPGRVFSSPADFNAQLADWLAVANRRHHRSIQARPTDRWEADRARMLTIPPVTPPHWWRFPHRVGRDHYVRVDTNDYSIDPAMIGRAVMVRVDNDEVSAIAGNTIVARHARCWARHQTITDPDHAAAAKQMRAAVGQNTARPPSSPPPAGTEVEQRDLAVYDRAFTVIDGGAAKTSKGEV